MNFRDIDENVALATSTCDALPWSKYPKGEGPQPYYRLVQLLALREKRKGVILEIGAYQGTMAAVVTDAKALHPHLIVSIDINHIEFADPRFIFLHGDSTDAKIHQAVKTIAQEHGGVFAVFQDSSHHYFPSIKEWRLYSPLVRPGGVWLCDDITPAFRIREEPGGMVEYFHEIPRDPKRIYGDLHHGSMVGVIPF